MGHGRAITPAIKSAALSGAWLAISASALWAGTAQGKSLILTKDLWGASGGLHASGGEYVADSSFGEPAAGVAQTSGLDHAMSGYYAGLLGNGALFRVLRISAQGIGPVTDDIQLGVSRQSPVEITLSDQAQSDSLDGISVSVMQDHLGRGVLQSASVQTHYDPAGSTIELAPPTRWMGNTLYDVTLSTGLENLDGVALDEETHFRFLTLLDPTQENVVMTPVDAGASASSSLSTRPLRVDIAPGSSSGDAMVLWNAAPEQSPLFVDPSLIARANQKAALASDGYSSPLAMEEIAVFDAAGRVATGFSASAQLTWPLGNVGTLASGAGAPVRANTLALWTLDTDHALWVRLPTRHTSALGPSVEATVGPSSVFALMGSADGAAADAYAFPVPWRPHGPSAGAGADQTGTEAGGITFANLPSECTIKIFTLAGDQIGELHHSDTAGPIARQTWDAKTSNGSPVASGVYLWRVQSPSDGKTGKLMIIR